MKLKMIFKVISIFIISGFVLTWPSQSSEAESVYFTTRGVLRAFFPKSDKVSYVRFTPTKAQRQLLRRRLGYELRRKSYIFYVAKTDGKIDGYAFIDNEKGQHLPITFAVKMSPRGVVVRQEVVIYREPRGDEIRDARFKKQFVGKTSKDPVRANVDIVAISGATISTNSMAIGVKRALVLFDAASLGDRTRTRVGGRSARR